MDMITIKLFAILKDRAGCDELHIDAHAITIAELLNKVSREYPTLSDMLSCEKILVSINQEYAGSNATVRDGDEVAFMPPFSGGAIMRGSVRIQEDTFSLEQEVGHLKGGSSSIGAIVTFLGTTRDISKGKAVAQLEFEHYAGMAEKKLGEIRDRAVREYGIIDVTIIHRIGTIPVGEDIVLIVVAAEHREEAFAACRFCIDELKKIAPIWKKETTPDGEVWVEDHP